MSFLRVNPNSAVRLPQSFLLGLPLPPRSERHWVTSVAHSRFGKLVSSAWKGVPGTLEGEGLRPRPAGPSDRKSREEQCAAVRWGGAALRALTLS